MMKHSVPPKGEREGLGSEQGGKTLPPLPLLLDIFHTHNYGLTALGPFLPDSYMNHARGTYRNSLCLAQAHQDGYLSLQEPLYFSDFSCLEISCVPAGSPT